MRVENLPAGFSRPTSLLTTSKPGSDVAGGAAAALAAMSLIYRSTDAVYADLCLSHAKDLFSFASNYLGKYSDSIPAAAPFYASSGYDDDLALAATWLHLATASVNGASTSAYLTYAESKYASAGLGDKVWALGWDDVSQAVSALLWQVTGKPVYAAKLETFLNQWLPGGSGSIPRTPKGLAFRSDWGSLRYATTTALVAFVYADSVYATKPALSQTYHDFAVSQVHYALGDAGRSYVVGFGSNYPKQAHHRGASCPVAGTCGWNDFNANSDNPQLVLGALVGGPTSADAFSDLRANFQATEVTTDYNAAFQGALARLYMEVSATPLTSAGSATGAAPLLTGGLHASGAAAPAVQPLQLALAAIVALATAALVLVQ